MKSFKNIWGLAVALFAATTLFSCTEDEPTYTPADPEGVKAHVTFAGKSAETYEVEPGVTSFSLTLQRPEADAASEETIELRMALNEGNVFNCPSTVTFAAGQTEVTFTVTVSGAEDGVYYNMTVVADGNQSDYTEGLRAKNVTFAIMKWESIGTGYWVGNTICDWFGADQLPMAVEVFRAETSTSVRFRFSSPYEKVATAKLPIGDSDYVAYDGYPYNAPSEIVSTGNLFLIICDKEGNASLSPVNMGNDWGYGEFSCGQIYGNLSSNLDSYPLGVYTETETGGTVYFAPNTLYRCMANYNGGGKYLAPSPAYLYLSAEDFIAGQVKPIDYDTDYEWQSIEDALGTFVSTAADDEWIQDLEAAVRVADGELEEGLYRFPDLFADGYPIVFNMTEDNGAYLISTPKAQKTGMVSLGGEMIWTEIKSGKRDENNELTLNMAFYTLDSKGNKAVDFGTMTETFKWGVTGITIDDLKGQNMANYVGIWKAPFVNLNDGSEAFSYVRVTPSADYEGCLVIEGLSALDDYNDAVIAEWSSQTGLVTLGAQWAEDLSGYNMLFTGYNPFEGYYTTASTMIGGLTEDGIFAFLNNPDNEDPVQSMRYFACSNGSVAGVFSNWIPYPMEWEFVQDAYAKGLKESAEFSNELNGVIKKAGRKMNSTIQGQKVTHRQLIDNNAKLVY